MKELYKKFIGSFDNEPNGFSSRKLTAFALMTMVIITHIKWITLGDFTQLENVLSIDYAFIAALFGMTTYQSLKQAKPTTTDTPDPAVDKSADADKK